ncbi:hypothetical protein LJC34_07410 [Oscillospiraceae bacterium OttesenSCG-928-G22]|nr:hypothetical protein [Oscillospiraceae bacterium OttesenSCG-928-G22]
MNDPITNIIPFYTSDQAKAAEKEKMLNALKYRMAISTLARLLKNNEITPCEFEQGRAQLARRWGQDTV